jgi:hypothetical protein
MENINKISFDTGKNLPVKQKEKAPVVSFTTGKQHTK